MAMIKAANLNLGDVVRLFGDEYSYATVLCKDADGCVEVRRPYMHTAEFSYTGGVIGYIGHEDVSLCADREVERVSEGRPLK